MNQSLTAIVTSAETSLRWLDRERSNLDKARQSIVRLAQDGKRAGEVVSGLRALAGKSDLVSLMSISMRLSERG